MVITGLTRNQFVPKAHEGSNPSLCAKRKDPHAQGVGFFPFGVVGRCEPCARSERGFAHPTRRSTSLLVRRRVRVSSPKANIPQNQECVGFFLFGAVGRCEPCSRSERGFAYPTRRSTSLLVRRRVWVSSPKTDILPKKVAAFTFL